MHIDLQSPCFYVDKSDPILTTVRLKGALVNKLVPSLPSDYLQVTL